MFFELLTAAVGAGYGVYQAGERERQTAREAFRADLMYQSTKKRAQAEEAMLQNRITIGAMDNTANNKASAISEYQNRSMQVAQAGVSGASSGTPFYRIDADAIQNRKIMADMETKGRLGLEGMGDQLESAKLANTAQISAAFDQYQDTAESAAYAASPFAYIMGGLTGALSGASMGADISSLTKEVFHGTVDELVGGGLSAVGGGFGKVGEAINQAAMERSISKSASSVATQRAGGMYANPMMTVGPVVGRSFKKPFSLAALFPSAMGYQALNPAPSRYGQGNMFGGSPDPASRGSTFQGGW